MKEEYISMETLEKINRLKKENIELKQELKNKPDAKYTLTTADGKEFTIIQSERIDMQEELNKSILGLQQRIDKAIEHLKESIDDYLKDDKDLDGTCNVICVETIKKRYLEPVLNILRGKDNE